MLYLSNSGAVIVPPMPAFYNKPKSLDDVVNHFVARILDQFGIDNDYTTRWGEKQEKKSNEK
jgi:4-hydroxy-3-polyprenylbenzoate decarboxylase